jgi:hypothetical protein
MLVDVSELLTDSDLGADTFTRLRPTTTMANEGEAGDAFRSEILTGIIQPAATADAQFLPEGVRLSDVQAFFTSGDLSAGDPDLLPDVLQYKGITYRVMHVQDFDKHGMVKALAQRIAAGTPPVEGP